MGRNKKARMELAMQKAKQKRTRLIVIASVVALTVAAILIVSLVTAAGTERYGDGNASISLRPGGKFTATLYHENLSGTYSSVEEGIAFTYGGVTVIAEVEDGLLYLPAAWDDGHGHGNVLFKY